MERPLWSGPYGAALVERPSWSDPRGAPTYKVDSKRTQTVPLVLGKPANHIKRTAACPALGVRVQVRVDEVSRPGYRVVTTLKQTSHSSFFFWFS